MNYNLLICLDLGNSCATYGIHRGGRLCATGYVPSVDIPDLMRIIRKSGTQDISIDYMICSVVPDLTRKLVASIKKLRNTDKVFVIGKNLRFRFPMRYSSKSLGADRLVNLYGARLLYKAPCLIVDFGTAITFDYLSRSGTFEGGLICPGVELSAKALSEKAALLPSLTKIEAARSLLGRGTKAAMCAGLLNGFGALADGLIDRFRKEYDRQIKVIATGGFSTRIAPYVHRIDVVDPLHTLKSLALIYKNEVGEA